MSQNKKEQLQEELELERLGIDIEKIDQELLNTIYEFIGGVYSNIKEDDQIINIDKLNNFTEQITKEGKGNVDKKDS